jgi:hypothetical protein
MTRAALLVIVALLGVGCDKAASPTAPDSPPASSPPPAVLTVTAADLAFCVSDVNRVRVANGRSVLVQSPTLDAFATAGAQADHASGTPHGHILAAGGGLGYAENELLRQPVRGTVQMAMQDLTRLSLEEGPGGGHYQNLLGAWSGIGCGGALDAAGITIVQDFH